MSGNASALAKAAGISQSGFHRYLSGGEPTRKVLVALAKAANVSLTWLATGEGQMTENRPQADMETLTRLPLYEAAVSPSDFALAAGQQTPAREKQLRALAFCRKWLGIHGLDAARLAAMSVRGDSMAPTIQNGDTLLIDTGDRSIVDGDIYLIRDGDEALIRRMQRQLGGKLRMLCDNPTYPVVEAAESAVEVVGRIVWRGSLF